MNFIDFISAKDEDKEEDEDEKETPEEKEKPKTFENFINNPSKTKNIKSFSDFF